MRNGKNKTLGSLNNATQLGFEPTQWSPHPSCSYLGTTLSEAARFHPHGFHSLSSF